LNDDEGKLTRLNIKAFAKKNQFELGHFGQSLAVLFRKTWAAPYRALLL
jgi:hypothetical protein